MPDLSVEWMMVGSLALVVILQQIHRGIGASAAIVWLVALAVFGGNALHEGQLVSFLGIRVPDWLFAGFTIGLIAYNARVFARWFAASKTTKSLSIGAHDNSPVEAGPKASSSDH